MSEQRRPELPLPLSLTLEGDSSRERVERLWAAVCARRGFGGHSEPPKPGSYVLRAPLSRALSEDDDIVAERSRLWRAIQALRRERRARSAWSGWAWRGGFATAASEALDLPVYDTQCGAKVLHQAAVRRITPLLSSRDFLFDVDLLLAAHDLGLTVAEVPTVWVDQAGSKVDALRDARRMAASALRLWFHHRVLPVEPTPAPATGAHAPPLLDVGEVIDLTDHIDRDRRRDEHLVGA